MALKLKIAHRTPRKTNAVLCQAQAAPMTLVNVYKGLVAEFTVKQKCA